jgi:hypothetical protein
MNIENGTIVALTIGLTQLGKQYIPEKFVPLFAVGIGVALSLAIVGLTVEGGLTGLMAGLASCGLYDQAKIVK